VYTDVVFVLRVSTWRQVERSEFDNEMNKVEGSRKRHCHECGRPIGSRHRGFGLCRVCENELGYWLRSDESGWKRNERTEVLIVEDSLFLDDDLTQDRKRQDGRRQPPRKREYLSVYEGLETGKVNDVTTCLDDCDAAGAR
jgi:ribosomal protein S14